MRKAVKILCFIVIFTVAFLLQLVNSTAHSISANEAVALGWQSPVSGKIEVLKEFDKPAKKWNAGHRGVDLASADGAVRSPADGTVVFAGTVVDRQVITIEHANGLRSSFEPITEPLKKGTKVSAGQKIARIDPAQPHCAVQCVHWGVREGAGKRADYLNPLLFLGLSEPSVLLPFAQDFSA